MYLEEYSQIMSPIAQTLDYLQREENLMFGCLIPSLVSLSVKFKKIAKGDFMYLKTVAIDMEENLKKRFH